MDLIQAYQDEDSDSKKVEGSDELPQPVLKKMHVNVAPEVPVKSRVRCYSIYLTNSLIIRWQLGKAKMSLNTIQQWIKCMLQLLYAVSVCGDG